MIFSLSYNYLKWLSLALLAIFMALYIKKNYNDEKAGLQKEVGYLFVNAVKDLEGSLLNDIVFKHTANFKSIKSDSLKILTFIGDSDSSVKKEKFNIKISADQNIKLNEVHGAISMIMDVRLDSNDQNLCIDTLSRKNIVFQDLADKFADNLKKANIEIDYNVLKTTSRDTSALNRNIVASASYLDIVSGDKYDVVVNSFKNNLIWKIIPETLFALLVFGMIWLAFYMLQKSMLKENKLMEAKNDFMQNMTHELKTPIATASVALEALTDFNAINDAGKRDEYIQMSKVELKRLSYIVDKVLSLQTMDKEIINLYLEKVNLLELVDEILNAMKIQFSKKGIALEKNIDLEEVEIYTDKSLLTGILHNLLDNACKYSVNPHAKIKISISNQGSNIKIDVADNGLGIEKENLSKIFQKFYRVPNGNIHTIKGHGLGLSFVEQAVKTLGGTIEVESEPNHFTIFSFLLPLKKIND